MTKCEQAQKGLDELLDRLEQLMDEADSAANQLCKDPSKSLSVRMRVTMVQVLRSIMHYANHMGGFRAEVAPLPRISYREDQASLELDEEERAVDETRAEEELEILGSIGFKNAKEPYVKFPEAIGAIDKMCKELCQKLYVGENAQLLVGPEKVPEYLTLFLEKMKRQAEEFKINQMRQLRASAARFEEQVQRVPQAVFKYLATVYTNAIEQRVSSKQREYDAYKRQDSQQKEHHLRMFRPNLENPANKDTTAELNSKETERTEKLKEVSPARPLLLPSCLAA